MTEISVSNLTKRYPINSKFCNVDGMTFTVEDGEFFCLVGPSNSGKTSTLRLIAGLDAPGEGTVEFGDRPMADVPPGDRGASLLFDNLALYPNKTGFENIEHPLKVEGVPEAERRERVEEMAERLSISHLLDRTPETFSGGEKQRVGIARTMISESAVYLLDDPLGGLDAKLKKRLRFELKRIHEELGGTFIYVTHDQEEAMSVADRIGVCRDGRIEQLDEPEALFDRPESRFVAEFIGSPKINVLDGSLSNGHVTAGPFAVETDDRAADVPGGDYAVGVRPSDVTLFSAPSDGDYTATVTVTEPLGAETIVDVDADGTELRCVTSKSFAKDLDIGADVGVSVRFDHLYLVGDDDRVVLAPRRDVRAL
jgi:multiple sugar transport system ATP-binding protein